MATPTTGNTANTKSPPGTSTGNPYHDIATLYGGHTATTGNHTPSTTHYHHKCHADFCVPLKTDEDALIHPSFLVKGLIDELYKQDTTCNLVSLDGLIKLTLLKNYPTGQKAFLQYVIIKDGPKTKTTATIHAVFNVMSSLPFGELKKRAMNHMRKECIFIQEQVFDSLHVCVAGIITQRHPQLINRDVFPLRINHAIHSFMNSIQAEDYPTGLEPIYRQIKLGTLKAIPPFQIRSIMVQYK